MDDDQEFQDLRDIQPSSFRHVIGQSHVTKALEIACEAAFHEGKRLDEVLLCGPGGTGKSALAAILAQELAVPFTEVLAQSISNTAELNSVLLSASDGILFLDEIHLLHSVQQHSLLQVLDKRRLFIGGGKSIQSIPVAPFTLVGATTDLDGRIIGPLIDRFRLVLHLDFYSQDELAEITKQRCRALRWEFEPDLLGEIAKRGRGTPRIALRLLQSARRVQIAEGGDVLSVNHLRRACEVERISDQGLDNVQQKYLHLLGSGPARLNVLASLLGVSTKVLTANVEPFLQRQGLVVKTDAGLRTLTESGQTHLESLRPASVRNTSD